MKEKKPAKAKRHQNKTPKPQAIQKKTPHKNITRSIYVKYQKTKEKKIKSQEPHLYALACDFFPSFNPINPLPLGKTLACRVWRR